MITIDIGQNGEEKIHHLNVDLKWYLLIFFLIEVSYFLSFHIIDHISNISWYFVIIYFLTLLFLFMIVFRIRRQAFELSYLITFALGIESITYFSTILYYSAVSKSSVKDDTGFTQTILLGLTIIFSILPSFGFFPLAYHIFKAHKCTFHSILSILLVLFSLFVHLYCVHLINETLNKNDLLNITNNKKRKDSS